MTPAIPQPRFTFDDANAAAEAWGFNCGPASLAVILRLTPDDVRPHLKGFEQKRYTNPTMMLDALRSLRVAFTVTKPSPDVPPGTPMCLLRWPDFGLARIQWHGPWMAPGVPMRARYRHTHWVAAMRHPLIPRSFLQQKWGGVWDINALNNGTGWCSVGDWSSIIVPHILSHCEPKADGQWSISHSIEIEGRHA